MYQVLTQERPGEPWRFLAHGARYTREEADEAAAKVKQRGARVRVISCGTPLKGSN